MTRTVRISHDVFLQILTYRAAYERTFGTNCSNSHAIKLAIAHKYRRRGRRPAWVNSARHELTQMGMLP